MVDLIQFFTIIKTTGSMVQVICDTSLEGYVLLVSHEQRIFSVMTSDWFADTTRYTCS